MSLSLKPVPIPTGGVVGITFTTAVSGNITLSRSTYPTIVYSTLYSGVPFNPRGDTSFFLDIGDGLPGPLSSTSQYIYQLTDVTGTITSDPVTPVAMIKLPSVIDELNFIPTLINLLQGAINSIELPNGIKRPRVINAMPLTGLLPMPFIVIAPELTQQEEVPIGQSNVVLDEGFTEPPWHNISTQTAFESNMYRITVFSTNAPERDYYRRLVINTFRANLNYVFQQMAEDVVHRYQAASFQTPGTRNDIGDPGFYGCDIMLEFTGTSNVTIYTNYGVIDTIETIQTVESALIDLPGSEVDETQVPITPPATPPAFRPPVLPPVLPPQQPSSSSGLVTEGGAPLVTEGGVPLNP